MIFRLAHFRALPALFGLVAVLGTAAPALAIEISTELQQIEKTLEQKVHDKIRALYGDEVKVAVTVHAIEANAGKAGTAKAGADGKPAAAARPLADADLGYAPFAADFAELTELDGEEVTAKDLDLEAVEVEIQAPQDMDETLLGSVKTLVESSLKGLNPRVNVTRLPALAPKPGFLAKEQWQSIDLRFVLVLVTVVLLVMIVAISLMMTLKASAFAIADSLKTGKTSTLENKTALTLNGGLPNGESGAKPRGEPGASSGVAPEKEYARNIQIIQQTLRENPLQLVQTLRDSDAEWLGLRSLLPALSEEERQTLKKCLGSRVSRLVADADETQTAAADGPAWLRDFVERVMLRKVQGGSEVEKLLGPDTAIIFSLAHHRSLLEAARSVDDRGAWRLLTEFYPKEQMGNLYKEVSEAQWWTIVSSGEANLEEIRNAAGRMVELIQQSPYEGIKDEKARFYRSHLLAPMVNYIKSVDFGRDDTVLDELRQSSPDLAELVREKVWTPSQLVLVPDEHLRAVLRETTYEQKAALLAVLPAFHAQRVERLLPEGNVRSIAGDQARRIRSAGEGTPEYRQAVQTARDFLDFLRQQAVAGVFAPATGEGSENSSPVREAA